MKKYSRVIREKNILLDSYWFYGDLNLMLNCISQGYLWFINNYINIACLKEKSPTGTIFFDSDLNEPDNIFYKCPFLKFQKFSLSDIGFISKHNITNFIKSQIDNNNFVSFIIDRYFLKRLGYIYINSYHNIMIYGYDDINQLFFIGDNSNTGKYKTDIQCTFAEIAQAYDTIGDDIYLIRVEKNNDYHLNIRQIITLLDLYINPDKNKIIYNTQKQCVFGIDIYDTFASHYDYVMDTGDLTYFNHGISVIYNHKKLMKFRLRYLMENNIINNGKLYTSYNDIEEKILMIKNRQLKYMLTHNIDLLKRNANDLKDIKEQEYSILTQMIAELKTAEANYSLITKNYEIQYDTYISPLSYHKISKNNTILMDYITMDNEGFISFSDINMHNELHGFYFTISNVKGDGKVKVTLDNENGEIITELDLRENNDDMINSYFGDINYTSIEKHIDERDIYILAESNNAHKHFSFNLHSIFFETIYHKKNNICNITCPKKYSNINKQITISNEIEYSVDLHNNDSIEYDISLNPTGSINIMLENCKENDVIEVIINNISHTCMLSSNYKQCITLNYDNGYDGSLLTLKNKTLYENHESHVKLVDINRSIDIMRETLAIYNTKTEGTYHDLVPHYNEYTVSHISPDSYIMFNNMDFYKDIHKIFITVASMEDDNVIEIRTDKVDGELIGSGKLHYTGGFYNFYTMECDINTIKGIHDIYFVFRGKLFNMFSFKFE